MKLSGFWVNPITYRFTDVSSGRGVEVIIPGADLLIKYGRASLLDEILCSEREEAVKKLAQPVDTRPLMGQMPKNFQHDFAQVIAEMRESAEHRAETGHGKFWEVGAKP